MSSPVTRCAVIACMIALVLVAIFFTFRYLQKSSETNKEWERGHRLPESVIPVHYSILLNPDLQQKTFQGQTNITIDVTETRNSIIIHSKKLNITKTEIRDVNNDTMALEQVFEYPDNEFWVIIPQKPLEIGSYRLSLEFNGLLGKLVGFYHSKYKGPDEVKRQGMTARTVKNDLSKLSAGVPS